MNDTTHKATGEYRVCTDWAYGPDRRFYIVCPDGTLSGRHFAAIGGAQSAADALNSNARLRRAIATQDRYAVNLAHPKWDGAEYVWTYSLVDTATGAPVGQPGTRTAVYAAASRLNGRDMTPQGAAEMSEAFEYGDTPEEKAADDGYRGATKAGAHYSRTLLDTWLFNLRMSGPCSDPVKEAHRLGMMDGIPLDPDDDPNDADASRKGLLGHEGGRCVLCHVNPAMPDDVACFTCSERVRIMEESCEVCHGVKTISIAGDPYVDGEGEWQLRRRLIPCPECTKAGRDLIDAENERDTAEHYAALAQEAEDDVDILARISDHDPGTRQAERLDDLRRDGQRWAAGLTTEPQLTLAGAVARELDADLNPERRAYCEGVNLGLTVGYAGLIADNEQEEDRGQVRHNGAGGARPDHADLQGAVSGVERQARQGDGDGDGGRNDSSAAQDGRLGAGDAPALDLSHTWPLPYALARALVGLSNSGDFGQGVEAVNVDLAAYAG